MSKKFLFYLMLDSVGIALTAFIGKWLCRISDAVTNPLVSNGISLIINFLCAFVSPLSDLIDKYTKDMVDRIVKDMAEGQGITEELKAKDQMDWVGAMNNIRYSAEDIIYFKIAHINGN